MKMNLKKPLLVLGLSLASLTPTEAAITINFYAGDMTISDGTAKIPDGSLAYLVASTTDSTFTAPSPAGFVSGDDVIIASTTVTGGLWQDALHLDFNLDSSGNWDAGDRLQLYWFPSLTDLSTAPSAGLSYGAYRTDSVLDSSTTGWVTPADGATIALNFATTSRGGSVDYTVGYANIKLVPYPAA